MRKQSFIHLHGLLAEVSSQYEDWEVDFDTEDYDELGVRPTSIQKSKTDHKEAIFELTDALTDADMETAEDASPVAAE